MPFALTVDPITNMVYVSDTGNNRVMRYAPNSSVGVLVAGTGIGGTARTQLFGPRGLIYNGVTNSLVIVNGISSNIVRWVLDAQNWTLLAGSINGVSGSSASLLSGPTDVAFDSMGYMYVADENNHRVQLFLPDRLNGTTIAGVSGVSGPSATELYKCTGVAFDSRFHLYVADYHNHRIQKYVYD
jgi:DNA-binding beta-propeller fold protein YncE